MGNDKGQYKDTDEVTLATEILGELKRQNYRFFKVIIALIMAMIVISCIFMYERSQWDYSSYEVSSSDGGNANFIGNDGEIENGVR